METLAEPGSGGAGAPAETCTLTTTDGVELSAHTWRRRRIAGRRTAVVIAHGFSAGAEHTEVLTLAGALADDGYDVVTYDARGHGASAGRCTLGDTERFDVAAAVAAARAIVDDVVVLGASMGAIAALRYAATDPGLAGLVLLSCPAEWRVPHSAAGLATVFMTRTRLGRYVAQHRIGVRIAPRWAWPRPPVSFAASIEVPVALVHGAKDAFIRVNQAHLLGRAFRGRRRVTVVDGHRHAFGLLARPALLDAVQWVTAPA